MKKFDRISHICDSVYARKLASRFLHAKIRSGKKSSKMWSQFFLKILKSSKIVSDCIKSLRDASSRKMRPHNQNIRSHIFLDFFIRHIKGFKKDPNYLICDSRQLWGDFQRFSSANTDLKNTIQFLFSFSKIYQIDFIFTSCNSF